MTSANAEECSKPKDCSHTGCVANIGECPPGQILLKPVRCCYECVDKEGVSLIPAPWNRQDIIISTGHGPFPSYFKPFHIKDFDCCGYGEVAYPLHYATSCPFTTCFHLTKPTQDLETVWWDKVIKNKLSRIKIRNLVKFLLDNESSLSPDPDSEQFLNHHPSSTRLP
ncbi:hypothetical protein AVEN_45004-1 [Araneus ventricosus]|uniref:Uncharacterized protein n=1 Tax=Araneus ventricosus TaxID=182803 RepID=A0A4Y2PQK9_ARAVE|nr:hypothetical protein AVEN_45004-1 [Araneus ventricosus]